jgi:hypothetical protein
VAGTNDQAGARFFYGWWVVFACAMGLFWGGPPVIVFTFPVFLKPIMHDFHAGRGAVSFGFTLHLMTTAVAAPVVGWLIRSPLLSRHQLSEPRSARPYITKS